jgi:hypothetical protein
MMMMMREHELQQQCPEYLLLQISSSFPAHLLVVVVVDLLHPIYSVYHDELNHQTWAAGVMMLMASH